MGIKIPIFGACTAVGGGGAAAISLDTTGQQNFSLGETYDRVLIGLFCGHGMICQSLSLDVLNEYAKPIFTDVISFGCGTGGAPTFMLEPPDPIGGLILNGSFDNMTANATFGTLYGIFMKD